MLSLNSLLLVAIIFALIGLLLWKLSQRMMQQPWNKQVTFKSKNRQTNIMKLFLQRSYYWFGRIVGFKHKRAKVYQQLLIIYGYDERLLREKVAFVLWAIIIVLSGILFIFISFEQDWISLLMLILVLRVADDLCIQMFAQQAELKVLSQSAQAFSTIRHAYQRHQMVELAVEEALERASPLIRPHLSRLLACIYEYDTDEALVKYDDAAPNRHYRLFARLARLVAEYGDPKEDNRSSFLQGLSMMIRDMQSEHLMRTRLDTFLKGLKVIAVIPILFANPIEQWGRAYFPDMTQFYDSRIGWYVQVIVLLTVIVSHWLLEQLQWRKSIAEKPKSEAARKNIDILRLKIVRSIVYRWMRGIPSSRLSANAFLLKDANESLSLERWYATRLAYAAVIMLLSIIMAIVIHIVIQQQQSISPLWGVLPRGDAKSTVQWDGSAYSQSIVSEWNAEQVALHKKWVSEATLKTSNRAEQEHYVQEQAVRTYADWTPERAVQLSKHLLNLAYEQEIGLLWWWELLVAFMLSVIAYYTPTGMLLFKKRLRNMEIRLELSHFYSLALLLRAFERMTSEQMLDWMMRSSVCCKEAIHRCLLHWDSGPEESLQQLKEDIPYPDFVRFVDQLELAFDQIPIKQAFDDAEQSWWYEQDMRKQEEEKIIESKAVWGRWFGFAPMYAIVFMYLVIPLVWLSAQQMHHSFTQIQRL
ncbi:GTPase SAR1 [Paenibacillus arenosi]|uniref:GTPase SAR1 n=1 Tax=Paenibacillus arenosi TaxID=2774142 RepID=A0ABR9ATL0_9BACL|nr:GTPase SAR1 [Paenibacillus arenosi]MBD8497462.1 GTPase SAR1 [Paenibacillus arenosi]